MKTSKFILFSFFILFLIYTTPSTNCANLNSFSYSSYNQGPINQFEDLGKSISDLYKRGIIRNETDNEKYQLERLGLNELTHSRTFPLLLLPLLATPLVPTLFAPFLILTSVLSLFFKQIDDLSQAGKALDFLSNVLPTEHLFVPSDGDFQINLGSTSSALMNQINKRFKSLLSVDGLTQIKNHTLNYFGLGDPVCQQKMVCDTAFAVTTRLPQSLSSLARTATGLMFSTINSNAFFRAWIVGLTKDNCTVAYESCKESPFTKILKA